MKCLTSCSLKQFAVTRLQLMRTPRDTSWDRKDVGALALRGFVTPGKPERFAPNGARCLLYGWLASPEAEPHSSTVDSLPTLQPIQLCRCHHCV